MLIVLSIYGICNYLQKNSIVQYRIYSAPKVSAIVNQQFFGEKIIPLVVYIVKKPKNNPHLPQTLNLHLSIVTNISNIMHFLKYSNIVCWS